MNKISLKVRKDINGIEVDFPISNNIFDIFNETDKNNQIIKCNSVLFQKAEDKTSINVEFECTFKEDDFLRYSLTKAYFFVEKNLFETVLLATGKKFRKKCYSIDLHKETVIESITPLSQISELELKKIDSITKSIFLKGLLLSPEPIILEKSDIEEILSASLLLSTKDDNSTEKELIQYALFYMNMMESQFHEDGLSIFHYIQRFRLVWSAFNSIYQICSTGNGDKKDVENYSQKPHVVKFFKDNFDELLEDLTILSEANLTDKAGNNLSELLKTDISNNNFENVSLNTLLCIYVIRNTSIHGNKEQNDELGLTRRAFRILTPLVTSSILEEINSIN